MGNVAQPEESDHDYDTVPEDSPPPSNGVPERPHSSSELTRRDSYINETYMNVSRVQKSEQFNLLVGKPSKHMR